MATLYQVVHTLEQIALTQPNVRGTGEGDLFAYMNGKDAVKYDVVYLTQNKHQTVQPVTYGASYTEGYDIFSFNIFYISRLTDDSSNALEVESIGKEIITNILRTFCDSYDSDIEGQIIWQPFKEKFVDVCAGVYGVVKIKVPIDTICPEI